MATRVLGFNLSHDSSVCLVEDGEIRAALALERTTRVKRGTVPLHAYAAAMAELTGEVLAGVNLSEGDVDYWIATSTESRDANHEARLLDYLGLLVPPGRRLAMPHPGHHLAHASAAFYTSGFTEAAALVVDAYGSLLNGGRERETGFLFRRGEPPERIFSTLRESDRIAGRTDRGEMWIPDQLSGIGEVYRVVTLALGFREQGTTYDDAGKTMGLAAYGERISEGSLFFEVRDSGISFSRAVESLVQLGFAERRGSRVLLVPRQRGAELQRCHENLAAQIQSEFEEVSLYLVREVLRRADIESLVLSGGCFLNSSLNARIAREVKNVFVFPAATDDGNAAGAALYAYHHLADVDWKVVSRASPRLRDVRLGPPRLSATACGEVAAISSRYGCPVRRHPDMRSMALAAAAAISSGEIIGWFQDRGEFGPRSLGSRSILCHPGLKGMKDSLNSRVKFRESFRPFAASVLAEKAHLWFELPTSDSPFMLNVCRVSSDRRAEISEVVHVDGTCRIQTVDSDFPGNFRALLEEFDRISGIPLVLNTSFNLRGMPVVERFEEAIDCLYGSRIDRLFIGDFELTAPDRESLSPRRISIEPPSEMSELRRKIVSSADGGTSAREIAQQLGEEASTVVDAVLDLRRLGLLDWAGLPPRKLPDFLPPQYDPAEFRG